MFRDSLSLRTSCALNVDSVEGVALNGARPRFQ